LFKAVYAAFWRSVLKAKCPAAKKI